MSKKRRREPSTVVSQLVEIYDDLANEKESIRIKAAHALLTKLSSDNHAPPEQLVEALQRLIRGLCSNRKAARIGFSVALTELLSQRWGQHQEDRADIPNLTELIDTLIERTEASGNISGQEERDHQFGRLFGAEAFIKSGILFEPDASADAWLRILDIIYEIAKQKPWLREECGWILFGACQTLKEGDHDHTFIQALLDKLCHSGMAKTPEGVAIWLNIRAGLPEIQLPDGIWRHGNPLHRKEKSQLAEILKEASVGRQSDETTAQIAQKGNWTSRIHFAWIVVLDELAGNAAVGKRSKTVGFEEFWREAIDDHLFAASSSEERKYWGFSIFQRMFKSAHPSLLPALFSPNLKRSLINQLASKDRYLHLAAERSIRSISDRVEVEPSSASAALEGLSCMSVGGSLSFDQLTKTKTLERMMSLADDDSLLNLGFDLCSKLVRPDVQDDKAVTTRRKVIADELTMLLKSRPTSNTEVGSASTLRALVDRILEVLVICSYFSGDASSTSRRGLPDPPVSEKTQDMLRTRLLTCLSHIVSKFPEPRSYVHQTVGVIRLKESDSLLHSNLDPTGTIGGTMNQAWNVLALMAEDLEKEAGNKTFLDAFMLLYSLTILQVYNGDADAVSMLDELRSCYGLITQRGQAQGEQGWEVLIEILLSLVAKPSVLFRRLAQQIFSATASNVNSNGLQAMVKVLETKENLSGREEMFEEENEDPESGSATSDIDSDVEEVGTEDANGTLSSSDEEETSSTSTESSEEPENMEGKQAGNEELAAFNNKLAQALKTRPANANLVAASDDASSDEDMDDEQMEALDEHIATIFKARKKVTSKKAERKDAKETIVNFKCRVLELLDIYVKQQHQNPLALDLLLPLLTVTRTTTSRLVASKACNLVREFSSICKTKGSPRIDSTSSGVVQLLKEVHVEALREGSNAHASACNQASLFLARVLMAADRGNMRQIVQVYAGTLEAWAMDPKGKVTFFTEWLNWRKNLRLVLPKS
ncbi:MAG: hypothetical protein LQ344_002965 [Seirophora lacunosa]|nr:MAG: hypothetical protein LQ344_002965 [Seirophora lacunosa]